MRDEISVKLSGSILKGKSLSALLREFERFNVNGPLIENIRKLIEKRNHVAHVAFYKIYEDLADNQNSTAHLEETKEIGNEAQKCLELLHNEIETVERLCWARVSCQLILFSSIEQNPFNHTLSKSEVRNLLQTFYGVGYIL